MGVTFDDDWVFKDIFFTLTNPLHTHTHIQINTTSSLSNFKQEKCKKEPKILAS